MWRTLKIILLLWPILLMILSIGINVSDKAAVDKKLLDPNTLVWGTGAEQITFKVDMSSAGEEDTYTIILTDKNGQTVFNEEFLNNKDMRGGGFVKGVRSNGSQEPELIVWGPNEWRTSYVLNYAEGQIIKTDFAQFPPEILHITKEWHQAHVGNGLTIVLLGMLCVGYYILVGMIWLIIKGVKRFKARKDVG